MIAGYDWDNQVDLNDRDVWDDYDDRDDWDNEDDWDERMNDFLMSKTWEVFTQSSEPEAHVKNGRQTKKYKSTHTSQDNRQPSLQTSPSCFRL